MHQYPVLLPDLFTNRDLPEPHSLSGCLQIAPRPLAHNRHNKPTPRRPNPTDKPGFLQPTTYSCPKSRAGLLQQPPSSFQTWCYSRSLVSSGYSNQAPTTPLIKLSFSLQIKRAAVRTVSGLSPLLEGNLPWAVQYSNASVQAISSTNAGITFKLANMMTGKTKKYSSGLQMLTLFRSSSMAARRSSVQTGMEAAWTLGTIQRLSTS